MIGATLGAVLVSASACARKAVPTAPVSRGYAIPLVDLAADVAWQVVVDREPGQYLGHPTTVLLEDGRTVIAVYPKGHGRGAIQMKRSRDGGLNWSERLPGPESWATSLETPTIPSRRGTGREEAAHRLVGTLPRAPVGVRGRRARPGRRSHRQAIGAGSWSCRPWSRSSRSEAAGIWPCSTTTGGSSPGSRSGRTRSCSPSTRPFRRTGA